MSKEERNYEIFDREMLGLIRALEDWRHFLEGIEFEVITDHKNMEWWATMRDLNRRQLAGPYFLVDSISPSNIAKAILCKPMH